MTVANAIDPRALALTCLSEASVGAKLDLTARVSAAIAGEGAWVDSLGAGAPASMPEPGRPERPLLVAPRELSQRKLNSVEGRAALIHAVAHIEFNAINLAWDALYRFPGMPDDYYRDWASVAADEARHFSLLQTRLGQLGCQYGDYPAHNGLWQMAVATEHDVMVRMALVPRVLEARGLDVTPGMIERLARVGDHETIAALELILREEVRHVAIGSRWFAYLCEQRRLEPRETFLDLLHHGGGILPRGPFNVSARLAAGFAPEEIEALNNLC
jgi:uncharacterized ferritin-like protein (DUF455 family)